MISNTTSITHHLLSLFTTQYSAATTTSPFLVSAADGTLSTTLLSYWLSQDCIYATHAYPRFIGSLIAHIPSSKQSPDHSRRILETLVYTLQNIVREISFFEDTANEWRLDLGGWKERKGTRDYTAEMARISSTGSIEECLVFLWAMEKVYLDAWSYIHDKLASTSESPIMTFASNWSKPEFRRFVGELAALVDDLYRDLKGEAWARAEEIWQRVLELEEGFWPQKGEETKSCVLVQR